jgi:hypothetical protein
MGAAVSLMAEDNPIDSKPAELGRLHEAESSISSGSQEILRILLDPTVRYRVHNSLPQVRILRPI